jgi:capsid protein
MATEEETIYARLTNVNPAFEGAETNYRRSLRGIYDGEADSLAVRELRILQNRSRHLCRNNGYGRIALKNWVTNAQWINTQWKYANGKPHTLMQGYWKEFISNPSYEGFGDMRTLQGISNSSIFMTGASHIRTLIVRDGNSNTIPLKLQLIPTILHDIERTQLKAMPKDVVVRYGMTFKNSIPIEYHYSKGNLDLKSQYDLAAEPITVPADEIIHTFIRDEPGQWLGIPYLASVIMSLYALDDLITATVNKQKVAQSLAIVVEQTGAAINMLPVGTPTNVTDGSKTKVVLSNNADESQVLYLNKGETVKSFQGTDIGTNFAVLVENELRKVAFVADALYHQLTGDTNGLNYSSLIGMAIHSRNRLEYLHNFLFIPLREKPIADKFKALALVYNSKVASAIPYFQLPRWRGIDDLKDAQADVLELQNGLGIVGDKLAERGLSIDDVLADEENRKALAAMGIFLDTTAGAANMAQAKNNGANNNSTGI